MGDRTGIEWTDATWNPLVGCSRVSSGCDNCYAVGASERMIANPGVSAYDGTVVDGDWTGTINLLPDRLDQPLRWRRPRRVFVNSMSDLFHPEVPDAFIVSVFRIMALATHHQFQVLTKRPKRMAELLSSTQFHHLLSEAVADAGDLHWPIPNVSLGTSIETDPYSFRADHLRSTPAAIRFLSLEPLLGALPNLDLTGIDWVIIGGESGARARPMHPDWVRDLRDRCTIQAADTRPTIDPAPTGRVAFFFKQWGAWAPWGTVPNPKITARRFRYDTTRFAPDGFFYRPDQREWKTNDDFTYPGMITMVRCGKKNAGNRLDGRIHADTPELSDAPHATTGDRS